MCCFAQHELKGNRREPPATCKYKKIYGRPRRLTAVAIVMCCFAQHELKGNRREPPATCKYKKIYGRPRRLTAVAIVMCCFAQHELSWTGKTIPKAGMRRQDGKWYRW